MKQNHEMEVYLDNGATTQVKKEVIDIMTEALHVDYGNPSSKHMKGVEAENYTKYSREVIAKILKCEPRDIVFTSCATESNNMALFGAAEARKRFGNHIITTPIEHACVRETVLELEKRGFRVTFLPVDSDGQVSLEALKEALCEETILVSVMFVNNEMGAIEPIKEIGEIVKGYNESIIFHVDGVQAFGKLKDIAPKHYKIDLMSASAHKFHGPKGTGFLYIRSGVRIKRLIYGGGQERMYRSGTENVAGIAGMGKAAELCYTPDFDEKQKKLYELREWFVNELQQIENVEVIGKVHMAPHIVNAIFNGLQSEVLLHALEEKGIYVSSGSACSSNSRCETSFAMAAMGYDAKKLESTIRFSFSFDTTKEELEYTIRNLKEIVPFLRQFVRK